MSPQNSPTVRQRRLAAELRRLRKEAGITPEQAAAALDIDRSTLVRYETAESRPTPARVEELLGLYGGDDAVRLALMEVARKARTRGWWAAYNDVLPPSFAELENDASKISSWNVQVIHGLLQTTDYARTLIRMDATDDAEVNRRLQAREHRKAVLAREDAPTMDIVLDEAVLRRPVGGQEVMRGQLRALLAASEHANISVRVLPINVGAYPYIGHGSVTIFGFPRDPAVAYIESFAGGIFAEDLAEVKRCNVTLDRISALALPESESAALIRAIAEE